MNLVILLFNNFETLDVFGPAEIFGKADYKIHYYSLNGGLISNEDGISIFTKMMDSIYFHVDVLLIPGGKGVKEMINNVFFIKYMKELAVKCKYILAVGTGSVLLARAGMLEGKKATTNKRYLDWVIAHSDNVLWEREARWISDGKYYTSSGISAGMDMALGFIADTESVNMANSIAIRMEYNWSRSNINNTENLNEII